MESYEISKVLNSSVVLAENGKNEEVIILGKGIGYGKKSGMPISNSQIAQIFRPETNTGLEALLSEVSSEVIDIATQILKNVRAQFSDVNPNLLVSLIDHINFALKRNQEGIFFENKLYYDVQTYYPDEFILGKESLNLINEAFNIELSKTEAASIAFHIADSRKDENVDYDSMKITKLTEEIIRLIGVLAKKEFDPKSLSYRRMLIHIKFFVERLITSKQLSGNDDAMYEHVLEEYQAARNIAIRILEYLDQQYNYQVTSEELMYLIIHINRIILEKNVS
ncbi:MAG: PRD domain-containing protein [Liquorilactobacillus nagelii]|jgi:beta-glucoside operon transcriptional antiterminator|uniref:PRD domain-containing protein n=1 Tax=Liquorilactobacillus nagelii TaxID=82688 RepID=UPI00242E2503|nr:PRD domain-containing protein [Liquorilactobacillus nagelii]MCI1632766.1 PRD domain-containing protein [Liquorilactobacillus nagelii]